MESVVCNQCGGAAPEVLRTFDLPGETEPCQLVRCKGCGLAFINPRPGPESIGAYYPPAYQGNMMRIIQAAQTNPAIRMGFNMMRKRRTPPRAPGKLLDVGCSHGAYLAALRDRGWQVEGVEFDGEASRYARDVRKLTVHNGVAEDVLESLPAASFDVVTMWHVLEHLYNPARALRNVRRVLKPGGMLMLEVPDFGSPLASLFGKYWFPLDVPRHLYHFTGPTLSSLLRKCGFGSIRTKGVPSPEAVVWSLTAAQQGAPIDFRSVNDLTVNPLLMAAAFPVSWTLAKFQRSDTLAATALVSSSESN